MMVRARSGESERAMTLALTAVMTAISAVHRKAARAHGKRRRHHTSAGRQQSMLSETEVVLAVGYNVERLV